MLLLVSGDLVDPAPSPVGEPGIDKVLVGELVEVLSVEGGFEVFEGPTGTCRKGAIQRQFHATDIEKETRVTYKAYCKTVTSVTALCLFSTAAGAAETRPKETAAAMAAMENFIMN